MSADESSAVQPIVGNKAVEDAAIRWVLELERAAGARTAGHAVLQITADIESPPRLIEVKAFGKSNRGSDLWLEVTQVEEARRNGNFFVYVVEHIGQGDPTHFTIKVLGGELLQTLLARAKEQRYFTVPWPVAHYDSAPTTLN